MRGKLSRLAEKRAAAEAAAGIVGVDRVINLLKVRPTRRVGDEQLADLIERAIEWRPIFERSNIQVAVRKGVAYLTGTATSDGVKDFADEVAARPEGITSVVNRIEVAGTSPFVAETGEDLVDDIENQIVWSPFLNKEEIEVAFQDGEIVLSGEVETRRERRLAEQKARVVGAANFTNNIAVR